MRLQLLIAEGDSDLREIYRRFLAERGHDVYTAADGLECLEKLRLLVPVVLVLDQELRWGGGDGVLAWLREQTTAMASVVLTTTGAYRSDELGEHRPPLVRVLSKPFALSALLDSVHAAAGRRDQRFDDHAQLLIG